MSEPVAVRVRDCACPGHPHDDGDVVYLRPVLSLEGGLEVVAALARLRNPEVMTAADLAVAITPLYVRHGAIDWNLTDEDGAVVPFDVGALLDDYGLAYPVGVRGDELYGEAVLRPLVETTPKSSRGGRTGVSTSASRRSPRVRPLPSARSSPAGSEATRRSA